MEKKIQERSQFVWLEASNMSQGGCSGESAPYWNPHSHPPGPAISKSNDCLLYILHISINLQSRLSFNVFVIISNFNICIKMFSYLLSKCLSFPQACVFCHVMQWFPFSAVLPRMRGVNCSILSMHQCAIHYTFAQVCLGYHAK